jgi:hypothetical protein
MRKTKNISFIQFLGSEKGKNGMRKSNNVI